MIDKINELDEEIISTTYNNMRQAKEASAVKENLQKKETISERLNREPALTVIKSYLEEIGRAHV